MINKPVLAKTPQRIKKLAKRIKQHDNVPAWKQDQLKKREARYNDLQLNP